MALSKPNKHFEDIDDDDLEGIIKNLENANSAKSDRKCEKIFVSDLIEKDKDPQYWLYDEKESDKILGKFWFKVRQKKVTNTMPIALKILRCGLQRCLTKHGHEYNIIKSPFFSHSQKLFEDACKLLKKDGYGYITHYKGN